MKPTKEQILDAARTIWQASIGTEKPYVTIGTICRELHINTYVDNDESSRIADILCKNGYKRMNRTGRPAKYYKPRKVIAIDYDNTLVERSFPELGAIKPHAKETLEWLHNQGHIIIINTCRINNKNRRYADEVKAHLQNLHIPFDLFCENTATRIKHYKGDPRKISADIYIDDKAIDALLAGGIDWIDIREKLNKIL